MSIGYRFSDRKGEKREKKGKRKTVSGLARSVFFSFVVFCCGWFLVKKKRTCSA